MTPDFYLVAALALFSAAISLALLAYAIVLNRRKSEAAIEAADNPPEDEDEEMDDKKTAKTSRRSKPRPGTATDDTVSIAGLHRSITTGRLIVKMGEQHYSSAADIEDPLALARLEDAAADLIKWLATLDIAKLPLETVIPGKPKKPPEKPKSMIEEINEILEERCAKGEAPSGLRLYEGLGGNVRVYVGVNSYEVDEVPNKKVRRVIKQAVAEWEARQ